VPATIAVLGGRLRIGLGPADLERIARSGSFLKASRRDLGIVAARGLDAASTVSATLWIARTAGIAVMATGGLGGVHRHAGTSFDVSNDLDELARADGALVVCSGAKSILDLPATLEALETRGVAVVGYQTNDWPAFTVARSGLPLEWRAESADEAAAILQAHRALKLPGAVVLAQPVPEAFAMNPDLWNAAETEARAAAEAQGITGKAVTPFLLDHVHRATSGLSLQANRALIVANAALAALVAAALADR
jgi:pseudouridine-5'-phosphate glycosidase